MREKKGFILKIRLMSRHGQEYQNTGHLIVLMPRHDVATWKNHDFKMGSCRNMVKNFKKQGFGFKLHVATWLSLPQHGRNYEKT